METPRVGEVAAPSEHQPLGNHLLCMSGQCNLDDEEPASAHVLTLLEALDMWPAVNAQPFTQEKQDKFLSRYRCVENCFFFVNIVACIVA